MKSLMGKSALLTGGTDGIGKALLLKLVTDGVSVTVVGRSREKWETTRKDLPPDAQVKFLRYDLSLIQEAKRMIDEFLVQEVCDADDQNTAEGRLDFLIHSAGVMLPTRTMTKEGLEEVFALQYLARFYINQRLLVPLREAGGKVIMISAGGSITGELDFDNLNGEKHYTGIHALKHESIANDMQILEAVRLHPEVHWYNYGPGLVRTNLMHQMGAILRSFAFFTGLCIATNADRAADDIVKLLVSDKPSGLYVRGPKYNEPSKFRSDMSNQSRLREISIKLIAHALNG